MESIFTLLSCLAAVALMAQDNQIARQADSLSANYQFEKALGVLSKGDTLDIGILLRIGNCNFRLGISQAAIPPCEKVLKNGFIQPYCFESAWPALCT